MRTVCVLLTLAILVASPAAAQAVRGTVVEEGSSVPVDGAMVVLFDAEGKPIRRVLTDGVGHFSLKVPHPGRYAIRVDRIGYASKSTDNFPVGVTGAELTLEVPVHAIELAGLEVESGPRCEIRPEEGQVTARIWEEARKALEAAAWTLSTGVYRYTLLRYARDVTPDGRRIRDEERDFRRERAQAPYVSLPAEALTERGFVRVAEDGSRTFFAPDARVLLSDPFLDTHCMRLEGGEEGLVGLRLEPVEGRTLPDIEGTLWLDARTARLNRLDFRYVNLDGDDRVNGEPGGEVVFGGLPNGTWVVREWRIRMPVLAQRGATGPLYRSGYRDEGGVVWRVTEPDGAVVLEANTATVMGFVTDSLGTGAVPGVEVVGPFGARVVSGDDGSFVLGGLPEGRHELTLRHPSLDSLGLSAPPTTVLAEVGEMVQARIRLPSPAGAVLEACGGAPRPEETGILFVRMVGPDGAPAGGRAVEVNPKPRRGTLYSLPPLAAPRHPDHPPRVWESVGRGGREGIATRTDHRGIFLVCDIPTPADVRIRSRGPGGEETDERLLLHASDPVTLITLVEEGGGA